MSKIYRCKHCNEEFTNLENPKNFMASHTRWCHSNPKRSDYIDALKQRDIVTLMNQARKDTGRTNQFSTARIDGNDVPISHLKGVARTKVKPHTPEAIEKIRVGALASPHRRLKKNTVMYNGILLDSSWELALAKRLDELAISWTRPSPLPWADEDGKIHNYFPDFYLPDYDLYLDPKNSFAAQVQKNKLTIIGQTYKNIRILTSLEECQTFKITKAP